VPLVDAAGCQRAFGISAAVGGGIVAAGLVPVASQCGLIPGSLVGVCIAQDAVSTQCDIGTAPARGAELEGSLSDGSVRWDGRQVEVDECGVLLFVTNSEHVLPGVVGIPTVLV